MKDSATILRLLAIIIVGYLAVQIVNWWLDRRAPLCPCLTSHDIWRQGWLRPH